MSQCATVLAPIEFACSFKGGLMTRLVAVIFFAILAGNAMAQAGGASTGASGTGAFGSTASTVATVTTVAVIVSGVVAASGNNSTNSTSNH